MKIEKWVSKKSEKNPAAFSTIQEGVAYMAKQPNETKKVFVYRRRSVSGKRCVSLS